MGWLWMLPSLVVALLLVVGVAGASLRVLAPETAWGFFLGGAVVAMLSAFALAGAGAVATTRGAAWRSAAVKAAAFPLLVMVALVVPNLGRLNPVIHDVTTDPEDTLQFPPEVPTRAHERPREDVLEKQREAYPDLQPLRVTDPPSESYARVRAVAAAQPRWEVVEANEAQGLLHATATSALFGFVDDIVIRVLPEGTGSRIAVRSRSRFGEGDIGANAARVRRFLEAYQAG